MRSIIIVLSLSIELSCPLFSLSEEEVQEVLTLSYFMVFHRIFNVFHHISINT